MFLFAGRMNLSSILIVGGGYSGTALAARLLRVAGSGTSITIIDNKSSIPGRGLAYGTSCDYHVLNVPAAGMSAIEEDPDHFLRWARLNYAADIQSRSFVARKLYARYLFSMFEEARSQSRAQSQWLEDEVLSIIEARHQFRIQLRSGAELLADKVVIATGNFPPGNPSMPGRTAKSKHYVHFAWSGNALDGLPPFGTILLVGSGLTSLDLIISLKARAFRGHIHILSRHGLLPHRHQVAPPWPCLWTKGTPRNIRALLRLIRTEVRTANDRGVDWRAVIDALRPVSQEIWRSLPIAEQRRFLRHVRPYWDIHRHRVAPEVGDVVSDLIEEGQVVVHAGKIIRYRERRGGAEVVFINRKSGRTEAVLADRVINCTGSEADCRRLDNSLITSLFVQGLARPDPLYQGLDADPSGAVIDCQGKPSQHLFAIGPVLKGCLWETTAVPEIRTQVSNVSRRLLERSMKRVESEAEAVSSGS